LPQNAQRAQKEDLNPKNFSEPFVTFVAKKDFSGSVPDPGDEERA
jgi:hypothetical protein